MQLLLLITYDIEDDAGRTKIAKTLLKFGFERLQYSVFAGVCTKAQWEDWHIRLTQLFKKSSKEGDKLYIIPQSQKLFEQIQMEGTEFDMNWVTGKTKILYY